MNPLHPCAASRLGTSDKLDDGRIRVRFERRLEHSVEQVEGTTVVSGHITQFEPHRLLQCGTMRWELEATGSGCILRFSDVVPVDPGHDDRDTATSVLGGWHWYLDALEEALAGRVMDRATPEVAYRLSW
jgi:hypothetical protein